MASGKTSNGGAGAHAGGGTQSLTLGDGARIAYRWDGPEEAPVLVLSNSLGTSMGMWDPQVERFSRAFRVLRYDTRGHGQSSAPPGSYSIDRLGRDVLELLDGLGIDKVHFCGLSLGGMIGQWLAVRAPGRLERLVLANTAAYMGPPEGWQTRIETVLRDGMESVAAASISRWFTPGFPERQPKAVAAIRQMLLTTSRGGYAGCCAAIRDMDQRPTTQLIHTPTLLVVGLQDPSTPPKDASLLAGPMTRPPERVDLQAAHLSNVEQPEAFSDAVLEFLAVSSLDQAATH